MPTPEEFAHPFMEPKDAEPNSAGSIDILLDIHGEAPGDVFGWIARRIGDVDGDGVADFTTNSNGRAQAESTGASEAWILVGAPGHQGGGLAYLYKGVGSSPEFVLRPDAGAAQFGGMFMSVVGDVNADGTPDLYVADWADSSTAQGVGKSYVFSGVDGSVLLRKAGEAAGDGFGIGVADTGDVNGDGHDDLLVGAWQHASVTGDVPGETLGFDTTHVGDVDGDGHTDFLVTSAYSAVNGYRSGRVFIQSGASFRDMGQ